MESKLLHKRNGRRTIAIVLKTAEDVFGSLSDFAKRERISAAQLSVPQRPGHQPPPEAYFFPRAARPLPPLRVYPQFCDGSLIR
jgi:hypothetical protein